MKRFILLAVWHQIFVLAKIIINFLNKNANFISYFRYNISHFHNETLSPETIWAICVYAVRKLMIATCNVGQGPFTVSV